MVWEGESMTHLLHELLVIMVEYAVILFELVGVIVILIATIKSIVGMFKREQNTKIELMEGMTTGLAFMLGSEILRTVGVSDFNVMMQIGGLILLRASITILLNWEIRNEEKHHHDVLKDTEE